MRKNFEHSWHLFVIKCKERDKLRNYLIKKNIETMIHYPKPVYKQPALKEFRHKKFNVTQKIYNHILSIPIYPTLSKNDIKYIVSCLNRF